MSQTARPPRPSGADTQLDTHTAEARDAPGRMPAQLQVPPTVAR